jgi:hypothetical protein
VVRARDSLAKYDRVHAGWEEDPDAVFPNQCLTAAARPEEIRRAYRRYGARFEVDAAGELTLRLALALEEGSLQPANTSHELGSRPAEVANVRQIHRGFIGACYRRAGTPARCGVQLPPKEPRGRRSR